MDEEKEGILAPSGQVIPDEAEVKEKELEEPKKEENAFEDSHKVLRKMIWLNTSLTYFILMLCGMILFSVWIPQTIFQILAFLLISLFGCIYYWKWSKELKPDLE